jgi:hypothetical protein
MSSLNSAFDRLLADLEGKATSILSRPIHILIDPLWPSTSEGVSLPTALRSLMRQIETSAGIRTVLPVRERWDMSGISRQQLSECREDIRSVRAILRNA